VPSWLDSVTARTLDLRSRGRGFHRRNKRLQRLQKNLCKRVYYFVNVYLNKNCINETKQNYDGKPSYSALRSITDRVHWVTVLLTVNSCLNLVFT